MTFNPEDFVFESIELPEENPTILEYDALQKFIIVRVTKPNGEKEYQSCQISEQINKNLLENIPDKYSNRNDRIILFYIREDGTYKLQKEKLKYNFSTNKSNWVRYDYTGLSLEEAKELFDSIKTAVWTQNLVNEEKMIQDTIQLAKKKVYLDSMYRTKLDHQQKLLRGSDWRVLPDAPRTFEGEEEKWVEWRNQLRDIVKSPDQFDTEMDYLIYNEEFKWPINPEQWYDLNDGEEYLSNLENHWTTSLSVDITSAALEEINARINEYVSYIKDRKEEGLSIPKRMYDSIQRYKLLDDIDNITVVEAEE